MESGQNLGQTIDFYAIGNLGGGYFCRLDWCRVPPQPRPFSWPGTPKDQPTVNIEAAASPNFASQTSWGVFKQGQVVGDLHAVWEPSEAGKRPWVSFKKCPKHKFWHFFETPKFSRRFSPVLFSFLKGGPPSPTPPPLTEDPARPLPPAGRHVPAACIGVGGCLPFPRQLQCKVSCLGQACASARDGPGVGGGACSPAVSGWGGAGFYLQETASHKIRVVSAVCFLSMRWCACQKAVTAVTPELQQQRFYCPHVLTAL